MTGDHGLGDLRFDGYQAHELADQVDGLRQGSGADGLHRAAAALMDVATSLAKTDAALRIELGKIGVQWQGDAAEGGTEATQNASIYAEDAVKPTAASSDGVDSQGGSFSHTRNSAPDSGTLRGPTQLNGWDRFAGNFGHTTDHAQDVQATNAARDQAISSMNGYRSGSQDALNRSNPLPVPPGMNLVARPVDTGTHASGAGVPGGGGASTPGGAGALGGPGGPGQPGGGPAAGPLSGTPGVPGGPVTGVPGGQSGLGPVVPPSTGLPQPPPLGPLPRALPSLFVADAAAIAGAGAQGAAAGASAEKDRLVRGRGGPGAPGAAPTPPPTKGGAPVAAVPDDEARAVRNAERFGAKPGKPPGGSIMQPAATAGTARREDDSEHVRKYGIESADVFEDDRPTSPAALGDEDNGDKQAN